MLTAIIVAGGSSRRMGFDKTFASLGDKPVVAHTIAAFEAAECVDEIILVGRPERMAELEELLRQQAFRKIQRVVAGGLHRQDSVSAGLAALGEECRYVAVHDAARPLVTPAQIECVFAAARVHGAAALAAPVTDTLEARDRGAALSAARSSATEFTRCKRHKFFREICLPQAFALVAAQKLSITDEVSAIQALGRPVVLVPNDEFNFKITFPADLALAEFVLSQRAR